MQSGTNSSKKPKWQDTQKSKKKSRIAKITELAKLSVLSAKECLALKSVLDLFPLVVLIETLLYCILYIYANCVLSEHLAECERFKYFSKCKVVKSKIKSVPSSFFGFTFLYLPNVFIHEPKEFIHVRVVNKLSKFKFKVQGYSVGKGDFWVVLPPGWNLLSVTLWCLHPGHCCSSTHLLYNFVLYSVQSVYFPWGKGFLCKNQRSLAGT